MRTDQMVVVIGAGVGGISTAVRLRAAGVPTILVDRNPRAGGKLNLVEKGGYRFDTGPSLLTLPEVFRELFTTVGLDFEKEIELTSLNPYCRYFFEDGTMFETSDSISAMSAALLAESPEDVGAFFTFLGKAASWYQMSAEAVLYGPPLDFKNMAKSKFDPIPFFSMRPFEPLDKLIRRTFRDERIRRIARLIALYTGCSPYRAPAIFGLIPFLEFGLGRWYVQGGLYRISEVLMRRYLELGGEYVPETSVASVRFEKGRAVAAITDSGREIAGQHFVVNGDVATASASFLAEAPGAKRLSRRLEALRPSTSAFVMMIGAKCSTERLIHHNILFSANEKDEWNEVFTLNRAPQDPTIYLNHPSFTDQGLAPAGGAALFAMVNVPAIGPSTNWQLESQRYADHVIDTLERRGISGLRGSIDVMETRTPEDFRIRTFADRGSLYGKAPDGLMAMMRRPKNREAGFDGVSFVGGTTHPGAGIPLAALSGKLVADMLLAEGGRAEGGRGKGAGGRS